jgi:hypothetical protein
MSQLGEGHSMKPIDIPYIRRVSVSRTGCFIGEWLSKETMSQIIQLHQYDGSVFQITYRFIPEFLSCQDAIEMVRDSHKRKLEYTGRSMMIYRAHRELWIRNSSFY